MRIFQVNNYADPLGGAEVYALALTRELARSGHDVLFFGSSPEREVDEESLRVVRRPRYAPELLITDPGFRSALESSLAGFRPDLVHLHNVHSLGVDVLAALGRYPVPIVQTLHDFSLLCPNSWCVRGDGTICQGGVGAQCFRHGCERNYPFDAEVALHTLLKHRMLASLVDVAISPSQHLAERMSASGFADVRHRNYFLDPITTNTGVRREAKELVFIGRLEPEKGVDVLLAAMPPVLHSDPEVHLTVIGSGALEAELRRQANALGLDRSVTFLSHVPRSELGSCYSTATGCVIPSIWSENSPLVAYECLAAGLPMIASRIGGIPELVEEGRAGFTFVPRDSADLARKVLQLVNLGSDERQRMSAWMRQRAEEFRPTAHISWMMELYTDTVARGARDRKPTITLDAEVFAILEHYGREKARLGRLFNEHIGYIRHLERTLKDQHSTGSTEGSRTLLRDLERSLAKHKARLWTLASAGPAGLLKRLARVWPRSLR